eukprot:CAMPEP_0172480892 /NCGR_PEP_ID=MMETSP1066-20121228/6411_1 /TAXON_ID=671091 /ORGANISM="Coscinodiscus wailesii, Strain CCMP2513" /LENGTH=135 /DNA_ID=CAMNT_0013242689 /DNA_START=53 /DNA_END=457 /DNA_ORIENTATION=+
MTNEKEFNNTGNNCISRFEGNIKPVKSIARDSSDATVTIRQLPMPLPVTTITQGDDSAIESVLYKSYRTKETFRLFWQRHTANESPPRPLPNIDFDSAMVLTAFRGQVNTSGYSIEITDVEDAASEIVVKCITKD